MDEAIADVQEPCPNCGAEIEKDTIEKPTDNSNGKFVDDCPNCYYRKYI